MQILFVVEEFTKFVTSDESSGSSLALASYRIDPPTGLYDLESLVDLLKERFDLDFKDMEPDYNEAFHDLHLNLYRKEDGECNEDRDGKYSVQYVLRLAAVQRVSEDLLKLSYGAGRLSSAACTECDYNAGTREVGTTCPNCDEGEIISTYQ